MTNYRLCWSLDRIEAPSLPPRQRHLEVLNFKEPSRFQGLLPLEDPVGRRKSHWTQVGRCFSSSARGGVQDCGVILGVPAERNRAALLTVHCLMTVA